MKQKPLQHLAIIPDGNRRWARARHLPAWQGHREGVKRFNEISEAAFKSGVSYFTFWAASEDNLTKRSRLEIKLLISLLSGELRRQLNSGEFLKNQVKIRFIGRWKEIVKNKKLEQLVNKTEKESKRFDKRNLTILFGYDGKREMIEAINKLKTQSRFIGTKIKINDKTLENALWTGELPPVDLVIRAGGEPHWSAGFMMWHAADSQFYFTETLWPDFDKKELEKALGDYARRGRRFGK